jgi:hypothetical protein
MIGKWLQELQNTGALVDYDITLDDVTKEYIVTYYVPPPPTLNYIIEFTIDPITQEVIFKENTDDKCKD